MRDCVRISPHFFSAFGSSVMTAAQADALPDVHRSAAAPEPEFGPVSASALGGPAGGQPGLTHAVGTSTDTSCCICLEEFGTDGRLKQLPCGHIFHSSCVVPWLTTRRKLCPLCKHDATTAAPLPRPSSDSRSSSPSAFTPLLGAAEVSSSRQLSAGRVTSGESVDRGNGGGRGAARESSALPGFLHRFISTGGHPPAVTNGAYSSASARQSSEGSVGTDRAGTDSVVRINMPSDIRSDGH